MSYLKNRNVLVTGATGFVGKHLFNKLLDLGANVYGISKTKKSKRIYPIDILNFSKLDALIKNKKIDICYHLAGESLIESGQKDPYNTFLTNINGTLNILESTRKNRLEKVIIASSYHVYGDNIVPYLESYTPKPSRPYETSKASADLITQSYANNFNLPVLIPRFVNIYGPGDVNFSRLIPKTIMNVLSGKNPEIWGGDAMRDYIYIDDVIDVYVNLGTLDKQLTEQNRIYNFGAGDVISVKNLITKIISLSETNLSIKILKEERHDEITVQYVSSEKAKNVLGFKVKHNFDEGIKKTLIWYKEYFRKQHTKRKHVL